MAPKRPNPAKRSPRTPRGELPASHPTAFAFLDESGSIAQDRYFAVGCLKLAEPSILLRQIQKLRDRQHRYHEIHFSSITTDALPFYREIVDLVIASDAEFSCFVADRKTHDPVAKYGSPWSAYEKLASQLLVASVKWRELITVVADNYSTPDDVTFEQDVRSTVNERLNRLAVVSVCRLDSQATDALQVVDLLTSAVTHDFRRAAKKTGTRNAKAKLASHVRRGYGVESFLDGCKTPAINVELFDARRVPKMKDGGSPSLGARVRLSSDTGA